MHNTTIKKFLLIQFLLSKCIEYVVPFCCLKFQVKEVYSTPYVKPICAGPIPVCIE